jgi:DNA-binding transcriptional regulator YiaG
MTLEEINELLELKGWSRTRLAAELDLTENAVYQWFTHRRNPGGPAVILMRIWLVEARKQAADHALAAK